MKRIISETPRETERIAEEIGRGLIGGEVIALRGGLGAGKTCFTRGLARGVDYTGEVSSPTFSIVNEYLGGRLPLYHFDMYRIDSWDDLYSVGFFEYSESGGVLVVEWSENIENALPKDAVYVELRPLSETKREIRIYRKSEKSE